MTENTSPWAEFMTGNENTVPLPPRFDETPEEDYEEFGSFEEEERYLLLEREAATIKTVSAELEPVDYASYTYSPRRTPEKKWEDYSPEEQENFRIRFRTAQMCYRRNKQEADRDLEEAVARSKFWDELIEDFEKTGPEYMLTYPCY